MHEIFMKCCFMALFMFTFDGPVRADEPADMVASQLFQTRLEDRGVVAAVQVEWPVTGIPKVKRELWISPVLVELKKDDIALDVPVFAGGGKDPLPVGSGPLAKLQLVNFYVTPERDPVSIWYNPWSRQYEGRVPYFFYESGRLELIDFDAEKRKPPVKLMQTKINGSLRNGVLAVKMTDGHDDYEFNWDIEGRRWKKVAGAATRNSNPASVPSPKPVDIKINSSIPFQQQLKKGGLLIDLMVEVGSSKSHDRRHIYHCLMIARPDTGDLLHLVTLKRSDDHEVDSGSADDPIMHLKSAVTEAKDDKDVKLVLTDSVETLTFPWDIVAKEWTSMDRKNK